MSEATIEQLRAGGTGGAEGHLPHHIFADQLALYSNWGADYAHHIGCDAFGPKPILIPGLLVPLDKRPS